MNFKPIKHCTTIGLAVVSGFAVPACKTHIPDELPNILWIVSEDNSAYFTACYGNSFATTPNIDKLASEGFLYTHAYCPNAVCAPSRNTILTGAYSSSNGNENMRSSYAKSEVVHTYPEYLHKAGYYCTNNSKTDYNTKSVDPKEIWDESSNKAHYRNRPQSRPFFAVFNIGTSHESSIQGNRQIPGDKLRHDPAMVFLPPYAPDTPEMRHDWAQYYDMVEDMDSEVGNLLKELEDSGLADNTIVMYYGDNGGVLARSKRFIYETGTQIPFVIRIPEKYKYLYPGKNPGDKVDRLINFVDLAPTLCSIVGVPIPDYMQGNVFLGKQKTKDPEYAFMSRQRMDERYDLVRSVRSRKYRYIRNFMPFRITLQHGRTLFNDPSAQSWEDAYRSGKTNEVQSKFFQPKPVEELYDTESDPWEVNNLAGNPAYEAMLEKMRNALTDWMRNIRDVGLIPESEYSVFAGEKSMYDYMRSVECPFEELMTAADLATVGGPEDLDIYIGNLKSKNSAIRYWGVTGLLILKDAARPSIPALKEAAYDNAGAVATLAAEALYGLEEKETARKAYVNILQDTAVYDWHDRNFALNSIDAINDESPEIIAAVKKLNQDSPSARSFSAEEDYSLRMIPYLLTKWGIK
jgi:N-sulfoglucosamine sulfohydrolase